MVAIRGLPRVPQAEGGHGGRGQVEHGLGGIRQDRAASREEERRELARQHEERDREAELHHAGGQVGLHGPPIVLAGHRAGKGRMFRTI